MVKKTKLTKILLVLMAIFITVFMLVKTYATDPKYLNIIGEREGNEKYIITSIPGYGSSGKTIWKIVSFDSMDAGATAKYDESIYCINPEIGFGSDVSAGNDRRQYNVSFNMKDLTGVEDKYKDIVADSAKFNRDAILWIADNMYLPKQLPEESRALMKKLLLNKAGITRDALTDNDIEAVQQIAIWYFSSQDTDYHFETLPSIAINIPMNLIEEIGMPDDDAEGPKRRADMETLYNYLITSAKQANYEATDPKSLEAPNLELIKPTDGNAIAEKETIAGIEYFVSGPYKFDQTVDTKLPYEFEASVKDQNGTALTDYKLLDSNKTVLANNKITESLKNQEFYIAIPTTNTTITKVVFTAKALYFETTVTVWTSSDDYLTEQPVIVVTKEPGESKIEIEQKIKQPEFDLALRKFITKVNDTVITSRVPVVDVTGLKNGTSKTATYTHPKTPVGVQNGDIVIYTIRIYNEGDLSGYAKEVTDDIPEGLEFIIEDPVNIEYRWKLSIDGSKITTDYLSREKDDANLLLAFDKDTMDTLHYKDVQVAFKVIEPNSSDRVLINIAEISNDSDKDGNDITDRDSTPNNNIDTEDDLDKEYLRLEQFDLALRKFITKLNDTIITSRVPVVDLTKLRNGTSTTAAYTHPKTPVGVQNGDTITYTIRVYNEGNIDGYAEEVTDYIPEGLEFIDPESSTINEKYKWKLSSDGKEITTDYLSEANSDKTSNDKEKNYLIKAFDKETAGSTLDYRDVLVEFKVIEPNTSDRVLRNIAEISKDSNKDIDSTPDNVKDKNEDDDDYEEVKLQYFDLALRKFITKVNETVVGTRIPKVTLESGKLVYTHTKEPILVTNSDIVIYTIRVYNEGKIDGYAKEVTDNIPVGLSYLPEHEINKEYGWVISEDGKTVSTDYLSKEKSDERGDNNLIKAFDKTKAISEESPLNPDYRDVQIAFKVTEKNLPTDRIIINTAEITDDSDKDGKDIQDEDSTPNNWEDGEDDIDKEYLKVKYFDLSLLKWVSKVIITENGKTTTKETGHTGLENPEPIVKVDLDRKNINKVTVKFGYVIKITNEGQIAGYCREISDYIPEGLEFVQADNPNWEQKDGKIVTRKLEGTLLQPGESAEVEVILKWKNSEDNMGLKVNVAEISEDYNEPGAKDIDSTPNNKKDGEDDIDDAPVMLSVKTGEAPVYFTLMGTALAMLAGGVFLIKKYVL